MRRSDAPVLAPAMALLAVLGLLLSFVVGAPASASPLAATVRHELPAQVKQAVQDSGQARVLVRLADPAGTVAGVPLWNRPASTPDEQRGLQLRVAQATDTVLMALPSGSYEVNRRYAEAPMVALTVDAAGLGALETATGVTGIEPDSFIRVSDRSSASAVQTGQEVADDDGLNRTSDTASTSAIQADQVVSAGVSGAGKAIVIVDTGVEASHPYLGGRVVAGVCFSTTSGSPSNGTQGLCHDGDPDVGYTVASAAPCTFLPAECALGTQVAGIAAGANIGPGPGVAPGANIIAVQIFSRVNDPAICGASTPCLGVSPSDALAAFDYVNATLRPQHDIAAVYLGVKGTVPLNSACDTHPVKPFLDGWRSQGIPTIAPVGDHGADGAMTEPACISSIVSVGSSVGAAAVAAHSNLASIVSLMAPGQSISSSVPDGTYLSGTGTSMAAAHVAGAFALLRSAAPSATVTDIVTSLEGTGIAVSRGGISKPVIQLKAARDELLGVTPGATFNPMPPTRWYDSRTASSPLVAGIDRSVQMRTKGIPSTATAVVMNVTITEATTGSYLTVYPTGRARPLASNINFNLGQNIPNLVTVPIGPAGGVSFHNANGSVHFIADVVGYYDPAPGGGRFNGVTPTRFLDSRPATAVGGWTGPLGSGQPNVRHLQVRGTKGVPVSASAVIMNVTITEATTGSYLTVYPKGPGNAPMASNLNFNPGQNIPNLVVMPVGADNSVSIFNANGTVHVIADVVGYFDPNSGDVFRPLSPRRILDSRNGTGLSAPWGKGMTRDLLVASRSAVRADATGVVTNVTVTGANTGSYLTVFPSVVARPLASNLNFNPGENVANLVMVQIGTNGNISIYNDQGNVDVIADVVGYFAAT